MSPRLSGLVSRSFAEEPRERRRRNSTRSGASILGGKITIVTIANANGTWAMDDSRSAQFEPPSREQASMLRLHANVHAFLVQSGITVLCLRVGARAGPYHAKAESHVCETILALMPGVEVQNVTANALRSWQNARGEEPSQQAEERSWELAFAAAEYSAEQDASNPDLLKQELAF